MKRSSEVVEFDSGNLRNVVDRMVELAADRGGWLNIEPVLDPEVVPPGQPGFFRVFSGRGPELPLATWVPGERDRQGREYVSLGIQHAAGPKAVDALARQGTPVPERWPVLADHPKRGLVLALLPDAPHEQVLEWLLGAAGALCRWPLEDRWRAVVYRR